MGTYSISRIWNLIADQITLFQPFKHKNYKEMAIGMKNFFINDNKSQIFKLLKSSYFLS